MKYRKLRIAWSVGCGLLCLLLIVLWVRSNSYFDELWMPTPVDYGLGLLSLDNCASVSLEHDPHAEFHFNCTSRDSIPTFPPKTYSGFLFVRELGCTYAYVPFWFLIGLVISGAAAPWLPWRFSLRTLLIGMTVAAAILGLVIWAVK